MKFPYIINPFDSSHLYINSYAKTFFNDEEQSEFMIPLTNHPLATKNVKIIDPE